ncbi:response regulator transcription factor [Tellurirhabdus rosea]|uniref:response regulator transcription factor n=1 Tax=Tellurirhabdus rosea TaxID=2674997 RepID=UPI0022538342|nr:response regulator [Tellurirhabdus rosea]
MAKILLIEDEYQLRENIEELLVHSYHDVTPVGNGKEGLDMLEVFTPDLIICDVMMPVMDGIEFVRQMKHNQLFRHIPVIFLTAKVAQEDRITGLKSGAIDYITKPFLREELLLKVENIIRLKAEVTATALQEQTADDPELSVQFVKRLTAAMEKHYQNEEFRLDDMAEELSMSRSALQRHLKQYYQKRFHDVLTDFRLRKAAEYLLKTDYSLQYIAEKCGFSTPAYFSRTFKEAYQTAPLRYRTRHLTGSVSEN